MVTRMDKKALLVVLRQNKEKHLAVFEKAWRGYTKRIAVELEKRLELARRGKYTNYNITLTQPLNKTDEYELAIAMVEASTESAIELGSRDFAHFVLDQWDWTGQFVHSTTSYMENDDE